MGFVKKALPYVGVAVGGIGFGLFLATTSAGAKVLGWFSSTPLSPKAQ